MKPTSLRRRLAFAFAALTLFVGLSVAGVSLILIYTVEDAVFNRLIEDEAERVSDALAGGREPQTRLPFVELLPREQLPLKVQTALLDNESRREASGDNGEHFHFRSVKRPDASSPSLYVLGEVEDYLVVRPMRPDIFNFLGVLSLVLTICAAVLGIWLAYRYTRPLERLTDLVGRADPAGLPNQFSGQFDDLETRRLATELETNYRRIGDFIERERRFTREASHELRTPLAVMQNALELLRGQSMTDQQGVWLERIGMAVHVMQQSVEALLMLAREELSSAERTPVRVLPLVERALVNHARQLGEQPVSVDVDLPADWSVLAPEGALQIIVSNLIGNAFVHCGEGEIRVRQASDTLLISNAATELSDELIARATEPEVKGEASEGMGLGLAIVERLCGRLDWEFTFHRAADDTVEAALHFGVSAVREAPQHAGRQDCRS